MAVDTPRTEERLDKMMFGMPQDIKDLIQSIVAASLEHKVPVKTNATRGAPGEEGRVIFNSDDGQLNIDDGTNWTIPDGTST